MSKFGYRRLTTTAFKCTCLAGRSCIGPVVAKYAMAGPDCQNPYD